MEQAIENSSSVHIASHVEMCICDFIYTHTTFTMRYFYSKYLNVDAGI